MAAPLCVNCVHFQEGYVNWAGGAEDACRRPIGKGFEPVRGEFVLRVNKTCWSERKKSFPFLTTCGPDGAFFEPSPKAGETR